MHDCLILGGGVIGLSLAYELSSQGIRVGLLDRGPLGKEASWAGAGILPPTKTRPDVPAYVELAELSYQRHGTWAQSLREETGIDNGFLRCGGIHVARDSQMVRELQEAVVQWRQRGIEVRELNADALRQLEPGIANPSESTAAYHLPGECQVRNPRHLKALEGACRAHGVDIVCGAAVEDFVLRGERIDEVLTSAGPMRAEVYCLTSGCWTGALARRLGLNAAIEPVRGQIVLLSDQRARLQHIVNEGSRYLVPRPDGRLLIGSTEEAAGFECQTTAEGVGGLIDFAVSLLPQLKAAQVERTWAGLRPGTRDGLPYLGRLPGIRNGLIAAGHFRSGLLLSTGTAIVMGQLIQGEEPQIDLTAFRVDR